jgi:hypothetical protein
MNTEKSLSEAQSQPSCLAAVISWCRRNKETLQLIAIGLFFQIIFFIGILISDTCL